MTCYFCGAEVLSSVADGRLFSVSGFAEDIAALRAGSTKGPSLLAFYACAKSCDHAHHLAPALDDVEQIEEWLDAGA